MSIIRAGDRHLSDFGWLKTYWLFSFSDYHDPENIRHGMLRVFNDDVVQPGKGFPTHPHEEMEIITIVLDGEVTHEDSMGNRTVIRPGDVQRMSAGTGLTHSEYNLGRKPVHFYQVWIFPDKRGLTPSYAQKSFEPAAWNNRLLPVASGQNLKDTVTFHTDATVYRAGLDEGKTLTYPSAGNRAVFVYVTSGKMELNGEVLRKNDQARLRVKGYLDFRGTHAATEFILVDSPAQRKSEK